MNQKIERSLEPLKISKRTKKQQVLCQAIEQNHDNLKRTIQVYVSRVLKNFGNKFDLSCDHSSIETISEEILHNTLETVLNKSEELDLSYPPLPWIKGIANNKVRGWQRDRTRGSKVISIGKSSSSKSNLSEEELLGISYKAHSSFNTEDSTMLEYLLSLVNESDRQILKLAFIDDLDGKSLAAALGVSEGAANVRKSRALDRLRKAYTQENPDCQEGK